MKYVKLTVIDDCWYKLGTEVWHYDEPRRMTVEEWEEQTSSSAFPVMGVLVRGIATQKGWEPEFLKFKDGCRIDGEYSELDEFSVEIVDNDGSEEIQKIIKHYSQK